MAEKRDYYEVLGIARGAAGDEIKRAYRQLARKLHPDVNKDSDAENRFKELTEAYEVLSDDRRRQMYDQFGHAAAQSRAGAGGFEGFPFGDISDLFESFFGGTGARARGARRGADLRARVDLTFEEAVFGTDRELEIPRWETCLICGGNGAQPGKPPVRCQKCGGAGEVRRVQQSVFGQFVNVTACDRCHGEGQIVEHKCTECGGKGSVRRTRKLTVTIPAGVSDGIEMRLSGEGEGGEHGGPNGNLFIQLRVAPHAALQRDSFDLIYELPLNVADAALGTEVDVPTLEGPERVKIPAGTQHGRTFRIRERGVPRLQRSGRGDFRVVTRLEVPKALTPHQRELFAELAQSFRGTGNGVAAGGAPQPETEHKPKDGHERHDGHGKKGKGILDKMKDALGLDDE